MTEAGVSEVSNAPVIPSVDTHPLVAALRWEGAQQFDPVRFHFIEVLAHRAGTHQGQVKRILDGKLDVAVADLRRRLEQSQRAVLCAAQRVGATPHALASRETLGDLVRYMAEHSLDKEDSRAVAHVAARTELKSVKYFRNTWSKLSAEKQVSQALGQAPKNAGPINSHVVALRSLALMRDTSPDYLNRFMSYMDTLLCLEQGDKGALPLAKLPRTVKTVKK